jgi:hypothetical protein
VGEGVMSNKFYNIFLALMAYFILNPAIFCQNRFNPEMDGADWKILSETLEGTPALAFISGFLSGLWVAHQELSRPAQSLEQMKQMNWVSKEVRNFLDGFVKITTKLEWLDFSGLTNAQIRDGIDAFYNDSANRNIKIIDALFIARMNIKGENPELIINQIRYLKMQPINEELRSRLMDKWVNYMKKRGHFPTYKEINNGDFSVDDMIKMGAFVNPDNSIRDLFCYGIYK